MSGVQNGRRPAPSVVVFDLDETLFDHLAAFRAGILAHLAALGEPYLVTDPQAEIAAWQLAEDRHYGRYLRGEIDYLQQRRERSREFAARHGVELDDDEAVAWFGGYHDAYRSAWRAHDDAFAALDAVAAALPGVRFGVITNGELDLQLVKADHIGITGRVTHFVASGAFGFAKPDVRIFEHTARLFATRPEELAYVGDRLRTDALGAAAAGWHGVWLDRAEAGVPAELAAEFAASGVDRIVSLAELAPLLTAWLRPPGPHRLG